jgi:hypothetical protein
MYNKLWDMEMNEDSLMEMYGDSDGEREYDMESMARAEEYYDKGLQAYSEGDLLKAEKLYNAALNRGSNSQKAIDAIQAAFDKKCYGDDNKVLKVSSDIADVLNGIIPHINNNFGYLKFGENQSVTVKAGDSLTAGHLFILTNSEVMGSFRQDSRIQWQAMGITDSARTSTGEKVTVLSDDALDLLKTKGYPAIENRQISLKTKPLSKEDGNIIAQAILNMGAAYQDKDTTLDLTSIRDFSSINPSSTSTAKLFGFNIPISKNDISRFASSGDRQMLTNLIESMMRKTTEETLNSSDPNINGWALETMFMHMFQFDSLTDDEIKIATQFARNSAVPGYHNYMGHLLRWRVPYLYDYSDSMEFIAELLTYHSFNFPLMTYDTPGGILPRNPSRRKLSPQEIAVLEKLLAWLRPNGQEHKFTHTYARAKSTNTQALTGNYPNIGKSLYGLYSDREWL